MLDSTPALPIVLDGGLSTALEEQGADLVGALWTARLLGEEPERIAAAHRAYFLAGAQVATTASYQASLEGLRRRGTTTRPPGAWSRSACGSPATSATSWPTRPGLLVAASVGPYGAFLADGSEYRGRYGVPASRLRDFHAPRLELLAAAGPDLFAVETIPDSDEAEVLVPLLDELGVPAWFSYSVRGDTTCAGQPLADAYAVLAGSSAVVAAGVNCSDQDDVLGAVTAAVAATGRPAVAYPNRGGSWDADAKQWAYGDPVDLDLVDGWVAAGAAPRRRLLRHRPGGRRGPGRPGRTGIGQQPPCVSAGRGLFLLVGDTGFEPVTSSVRRQSRATTVGNEREPRALACGSRLLNSGGRYWV